MTGRILFALVWLIIAAGVALPLYPRDIPESMVAVAADPVQLVAATDASGCEDCLVPDAGPARCKSDCGCGEAMPALFVPFEHRVRLIIGVTVRLEPSGRPAAPQLLFSTASHLTTSPCSDSGSALVACRDRASVPCRGAA